jgi:hydroxypyruvate isomerase
MLNFAANLSMMYTEQPFLDRFAAAAADGFRAVEYLFPYEHAPGDIASRLREHGLTQALFNLPPGDWSKGERGIASLPGREDEFRRSIATALEYARVLGNRTLHVMAGLIAPGADRGRHRAVYMSNLAYAADQARALGITVVIEPINTRDIPGFFLNRQDEAHQLLSEIGALNVQVQMDLYHCQIVEGDLAMKIRQYIGGVGHMQVAGVPERHEPDVGELNHPYLFAVIDEVSAACGWNGWVGCEYRPARGAQPGGTSAGLGWMRKATSA